MFFINRRSLHLENNLFYLFIIIYYYYTKFLEDNAPYNVGLVIIEKFTLSFA